MKIQRAYKTELKPNREQVSTFVQYCGAARFVYNWGLNQRIKEYEATGKSSSKFDQQKQLVQLKHTDLPWLLDVSKCVPEYALQNLDLAFKHFFRRCKEKSGKPGYPRFKSRARGLGGFTLRSCITVEQDRIRLPRIGWVKLKEKGYLPVDEQIKTATITEQARRWFVSVQCESDIEVPENDGPALGVDVGILAFAHDSQDRYWESPAPLKASLRRLRRLSRRHSRKQKGSANRKKSAGRLAKLHYRVGCQRKDFLHKLSTEMAKGHSAIGVEDLNVKGMVKNRHLARSISDMAWSEFLRQLSYKADWYGSRLVKADKFFPSTKRCSICGQVRKQISLAERTYRCPDCGTKMSRDLNAARNLLALCEEKAEVLV